MVLHKGEASLTLTRMSYKDLPSIRTFWKWPLRTHFLVFLLAKATTNSSCRSIAKASDALIRKYETSIKEENNVTPEGGLLLKKKKKKKKSIAQLVIGKAHRLCHLVIAKAHDLRRERKVLSARRSCF